MKTPSLKILRIYSLDSTPQKPHNRPRNDDRPALLPRAAFLTHVSRTRAYSSQAGLCRQPSSSLMRGAMLSPPGVKATQVMASTAPIPNTTNVLLSMFGGPQTTLGRPLIIDASGTSWSLKRPIFTSRLIR